MIKHVKSKLFYLACIATIALGLCSDTQAVSTNIAHTAADDVFLREQNPTTKKEGEHRNLIGGQGSSMQFVTLMKFSQASILAEAAGVPVTVNSVVLDLGPAVLTIGYSLLPVEGAMIIIK